MQHLTYQQAYDRIITAYFKDQIGPLNYNFCFCGTLSPDSYWRNQCENVLYPYSIREYNDMEAALLSEIQKRVGNDFYKWNSANPIYENALFEAMSASLIY